MQKTKQNKSPKPETSKTHDALPHNKLQAGEAELWGQAGLTTLVLCRVRLMDLVVEPHVGHCHPVLGQSSSFVWADGGRGSQGLHSLQVLH